MMGCNMGKRVLILVMCLLLIFSGALSCVAPSWLTETVESDAESLTLEEASIFLGVSVPTPHYLPDSYEIQEIYIGDDTVRLIISDETVEKTPANGDDAVGFYTFRCKMIMSVRWFGEGKAPPVRLPLEKVKINDTTGFLEEKSDHSVLWWNWRPDPGQKGFFEIILSASKSISKKELIKIAGSVKWK
jgi:hypothetical protein